MFLMVIFDNMKVILGFYILLDVDGFIYVCFLLFILLVFIVYFLNFIWRVGLYVFVLLDFGMILMKVVVNFLDLDNGN